MPRTIRQPISIESHETISITCSFEKITFFELVYIEKGKGEQNIEGETIPFQSGDFFLLTPEEHYSLQLHEQSTIHFIKFQKVYFDSENGFSDLAYLKKEWFNKLEYIFHSYSRTKLPIIQNKTDKATFDKLLSIVLQEYKAGKHYCQIVVQNTLYSILSIIARNLQYNSIHINPITNKNDKGILEYIHFHIYDSDKLSIPHLAEKFHIAKSYFSSYFKKHYGVNIRSYILEYKINLAIEKMKFSDLSLSEIAFQLEFSDVQHFNKTFKKVKGLSPSEFRAIP